MANNIKKSDILYRASKPDIRDYIYTPTGETLRPVVDLREWAGLIEDQLSIGSCTGNAIVSAYELMVKRLYPEYWTDLSRLFVYYNARIYEGTIDEDSGASIKNALRGLSKYGVCKESLWPYDPSKFIVAPSNEAYTEALHRKIVKYERIATIEGILDAINTNYPVVVGVMIYDSFLDLNKENYVMSNEGQLVGGHALNLVGYDLTAKQFLIENSFGSSWGSNGYCQMPFDYATENLLENWIYYIPDQQSVLTEILELKI